MIRPSVKFMMIGAFVAVVFATAVPQADAQWGVYRPAVWGYGYGGCYSSYTPCYSSCYTPCYSSCYTPRYSTVSCYPYCGTSWYVGWRPGPVRRLLLGRYRWYRGWDYCCGWGCGYSCCDPCCGDVGTTMTDQPAQSPTPAMKPAAPMPAAPAEPAPLGPVPEQPAPALPPGPGPVPAAPTTGVTPDQSGILTVWVPYDAKVKINGLETRSTGSRRQFVSYGLKPGLTYKYVVEAEVVRNGEVVADTKTVVLTAGRITSLAFGFNADSSQVALAQ